ncbi:Gfo/Idh/MocA family oxidoreductase [Actinokineospora sp.]|uniref:Gfo/Idh/MocA family oxidoreductase n=1 Tax=Actinokineospora sp. TaxID=1872133 RepID=UPI004037F972
MLGTLVVGLGRAGTGLHLPVLRKLRRESTAPLSRAPVVVFDPHRTLAPAPDVVVAHSPAHAATLTDPARTVVHLCTPPTARLGPLAELADHGFRRVLVEKPLAADEPGLREILRLREAAGLDLVPVGQWRCSELTRRVLGVLRGRRLGGLRSISFVQSKPRFARTAAGDDHPSAFDIEAPHSVGLALLLAGPALVTEAGCGDMLIGDTVYPDLGGAWLRLRHGSGVLTRVHTDLTSPVRERRITLEFDAGTAVGHFAASDADEFAQLRVRSQAGEVHSVFRDDSLKAFFVRAYRHFAGEEPLADEPATGAAVVELIAEAKRQAGVRTGAGALR